MQQIYFSYTRYKGYEGICKCGDANNNIDEVRFGLNQGLWCCKSSNDRCKVEKYADWNSRTATVVSCVGKAIPLTKQCFDNNKRTSTCNDFHTDPWRNFHSSRSHIDICHDNK